MKNLIRNSILVAAITWGHVDRVSAQEKAFIPRRQFFLSYIQWNEVIDLEQGTAHDQGMSNYSGLGVGIDYSWRRTGARWIYGVGAQVMVGKATAGAFQGDVEFPDGANRDWYGTLLSGSVNYRLTTDFMAGVVFMSRYRQIDWEPADASLKVSTRPELQLTLGLTMSVSLTARDTLSQSYAPFSAEGESQWIWNYLRAF